MRVPTLLALTAALLVSTACDDDSSGPSNAAQLRFVHAAPGTGAVTVRVDNQNRLSNVAYANANAAYAAEAPGNRTVAARAGTSTTDLASKSATLAALGAYTAILGKKGATSSITVFTDDVGAPAAGKAELRLVHMASSQGELDVYITEPNADIANMNPTIAAVDYQEASANREVAAGTFRVRFTTAGTKTVVLNVHPVTVAAGQIRSIIALDAAAGGAPLTAVTLADRN